MGMYNDNIEYEPNYQQSKNRTMSIFNAKIKFRDEVEGQYGPQLKLKCAPVAGGEDVLCYLSATHKDQGALHPGAVVVLQMEEGKKYPKYVGLADARAPAAPQAPSPPAQESEPPATLEQITDTWLYIYSRVSCLPDLTKEESIKATATVFITASQIHAWADKVE